MTAPSLPWDYSSLAAHYDKRADYSATAIDAMLALTAPRRDRPVADVGAGTGKLTRLLLDRGYQVRAVEPNDDMRAFGIRNTAGRAATWSVGTGEATGLPAASFDLVTFGSSFNVTDRALALKETARILVPRGWFVCMWNHRVLEDETQRLCEDVICRHVPGYQYGTRREDQEEPIVASGLFEKPQRIEGPHEHETSVEDFVEAWRSHATLQRQAGDRFGAVIAAIEEALAGRTTLRVPYTTRIWCARLSART